jgi:ankyrin repeat protein
MEMLWDECFTDADIQSAIENLPKDLNETYSLCLSRIGDVQSHVASKVLSWLCVAAKPFKSRQLLEALAIDPLTGSLEREKIPLIQEVLRCCSNLVIRDERDHILLAHHSVRQYLHDVLYVEPPTPRLFPLKVDELDLGRLCIIHLSSPEYGRAVAAPSKAKPAIDISHVSGAVLSNFNLDFRKWGWTASRMSKPLLISSHTKPTSSMTFTALPDFFYFAREQWALLTRSIDQKDPTWFKFKALALEPNVTYGIHPWEPVGISLDSHFSALLGWSINNIHLPLLKLLVDSGHPKPRFDIFNLPLAGSGNSFPLHLAVRHGHRSIVHCLREVCDLKKLDGRRRIPLHYASELEKYYNPYFYSLIGESRSTTAMQDDQGHTPLHLAAAHGHDGLIQNLAGDRNISLKDRGGRTALSLAAMNGHQFAVEALTGNRSIIDGRDHDGKTPLMLAVMHNHLQCARILIGAKADITVRDKQGSTALDIATREAICLLGVEGHEIFEDMKANTMLCEVLRWPGSTYARTATMLIILGASTSWGDESGNTALHYAARNGHDSIVALLARSTMAGSMPPLRNALGRSALHEAAAQGHTGVVTVLFKFRNLLFNTIELTPGTQDENGHTALHLAAQHGHTATVEVLLQWEGSSVNAVDLAGSTPLHLAAKGDKSSVVAALLRHADCNVEALDPVCKTALHIAAENGHVATVEVFLQWQGIHVNAVDIKGATPLHLAAGKGRPSVVAGLLKHDYCKVNAENDIGQTPLHSASDGLVRVLYSKMPKSRVSRTLEVMHNLILSGANVNAVDRTGWTPFHQVVRGDQYIDITMLLLQWGAMVNVESRSGITPLHIAAEAGSKLNVNVLLAREDIIVDVRDREGKTPWDLATNNGHYEVADLIKCRLEATSKVG